jgi:hypothetical protein
MYYELCNGSFDHVDLVPFENGQLTETYKKAINTRIYEYKLNHTGP